MHLCPRGPVIWEEEEEEEKERQTKRTDRKKTRQKTNETNTRKTNEPTARLLSLCVQCPPGLKLHWRAKLKPRIETGRKKGKKRQSRKEEEERS